ncbi:hypothetical protein [Hanstruepera ponticola]|uniref:hypothetical protein n=1 Tax=Hanstruepera ponticola TaxID=2042995 RepID=UPI00177B3EDB|nr:hypothetical protein [Hanstruepera ponticola]
MKPTYRNFQEVEADLKRLNLERKIAWEELKLVKNDFKEDLQPYNWIQSMIRIAGKYGAFILLKKLFKR